MEKKKKKEKKCHGGGGGGGGGGGVGGQLTRWISCVLEGCDLGEKLLIKWSFRQKWN